jgi:hypothetical protein
MISNHNYTIKIYFQIQYVSELKFYMFVPSEKATSQSLHWGAATVSR